MGFYYWINDIYCHADSVIGELFLYLILSIQTLWKIIGGISLVAGELYLAVLAFWGYQEQLIIHYTLSLKFLQNRPRCSTYYESLFEESRVHAMPSFEVQLIFFGSTFLILHMILARYGLPFRIFIGIMTLPFVASAALYITKNNTLEQILLGALVGIITGIRNILLYHYFLKYHLEKLAAMNFLKWIFPTGKVIPLSNDKQDDQDTIMLKTIETSKTTKRKFYNGDLLFL